MYLINVFKHGRIEYTEITTKEVALAMCHLCRRLANSGLTAQMEEL